VTTMLTRVLFSQSPCASLRLWIAHGVSMCLWLFVTVTISAYRVLGHRHQMV